MTITLTREEAQQVLDALEAYPQGWRTDKAKEAIETLRTRLAQPEPEPVAYKHGGRPMTLREIMDAEDGGQPQREWVGLTDEEIYACSDTPWTPTGLKCIRTIEAKLKEKNSD